MTQVNYSGLQCLQVLFARVRRGVNFSALVPQKVQEQYQQEPLTVLMNLATGQQLRPEKVSGEEPLLSYNGPALCRLKDDRWILLLNSRQLNKADGVPIFDPAQGKNAIAVPSAQLKERFSGESIIFHNLAQIDAAKHSRLTAFVAVAHHHNSTVDIREIMHEYAVGEEEVRDQLFRQIANDNAFKVKKVQLSWEKLTASSSVFPCIAVKPDGKYAVLCGFRK